MRKQALPPPVLICLLIALLLTPWGIARAQEPAPITAAVDRTQVPLHETLTLTVTVSVEGVQVPAPDMPPLDGFDVIGSRTSSSFSFVNGRMTSSASTILTLRPLRTGELTIPGFSITHAGEKYASEPIRVTVLEADAHAPSGENAPPLPDAAGEDFFIEAEVDKSEPYVGEALTYVFRFYQVREVFGQPYFQPPEFSGFWSEREAVQSTDSTVIGGTPYRVSELRTLLFPTAAGPVTIAPARLTLPGTFFDDEVSLETQPVTVNVRELPPGAPSGFNGAVGQFDITADLSDSQGKTNEPLTLTIVLSGSGNIENLPDPLWPDAPGWRAFESKASTETRQEGDTLLGSRTYERLMVPEKEGTARIPPIQYVFFDPQASTYRTVATTGFDVEILPGEAEAPPASAAAGPAQTPVEAGAADIRYLKPAPAVLGLKKPALAALPLYWFAWLLPLALLGADAAWRRRQAGMAENAPEVRRAQALRAAKKRLTHLRKQPQEADAFSAAHGLLLAYLEARLGRPLHGLTHAARSEVLQMNGVSEASAARVRGIVEVCEAGRFSPLGNETAPAQDLLQELDVLLEVLEKETER